MGEWISEVWRAREILYFLAWRDVKVRYKQAALGVAWAVLQPLFTMIIFTFFFGRLAHIPSEGVPYPLFSYSALVLWTYFAVTLSQVGNSLVSNSSLITKIYFPRVLLPGAAAFGGLLDLVVSSVFLLGMLIYYRITPRWTLLLTPVFVAQTVLLVLGVGMLLAALNVRYRDVKYTIPFLTQIGLFVTPIIYPVTFLPHRFQSWLALNPMTGVIDGFRACLFGSHVDPAVLVCSWTVTLTLLLIGGLHFRTTERVFADIV
ncbi:MAG TPA: ABC transporter permease [Steroidobacteraceae bacterium]|nr:ABC transporter permease [Steroidobacteraceae bacterium]